MALHIPCGNEVTNKSADDNILIPLFWCDNIQIMAVQRVEAGSDIDRVASLCRAAGITSEGERYLRTIEVPGEAVRALYEFIAHSPIFTRRERLATPQRSTNPPP